MDPRYAQILTREFAQAGGFDPEDIQVEFTKDEQIRVYVAGSGLWIMWIGSDDDGFFFRPAEDFTDDSFESTHSCNDSHSVEFPYPQDWLDACEHEE